MPSRFRGFSVLTVCYTLLLVALCSQPQLTAAGVNSSVSSISISQEISIVSASVNSSVHREALRVLEIDGCQAAVHKTQLSKASFLLEPLLCWRPGMEQLLCPGFDYARSRHFLRIPVLLADPAFADKAKRRLHDLFPTSVNFMNIGAIQFQLSTDSAAVEAELEKRLGVAGGRTYLLLRSYCTSESHCRDMSQGIAKQPSIYFERLRLSLSSQEYSMLSNSVRLVAAGPFACQNELLRPLQGGQLLGSGVAAPEPAAENHTKVVEVDGQLYFLVQQRSSGRVSFQRPFADYETGFGDPRDDYWMGLKLLHLLTKTNRILRVELIRHRSSTFDQDLFHAEYTNFKVGSAPAYSMTYSAFNKAKSSVERDALAESRGRAFSTMDRDNDRWDHSCSLIRGGSGGWWFNRCGKCNPNGLFFETNVRNESGIRWEYLDSRSLSGNVTLKYIRMLLKV
ncbi:hypothetical protein BOX15_Mlig010354g3 [Macrostomum lignano]|uniref:Fibrinogen C-terminal domain-containing protein n=2 Tax=Macrostomum lignano TaxID=282301 RepID=A0A1I8HIM5_9PLAT|nr:hypothetical protein BOX15_Mlig010354g1 [Macrostomum lignano]PAA94701.1 hypothetical protein BOX15_Mlig010354g3 [Macrostomum lignano]